MYSCVQLCTAVYSCVQLCTAVYGCVQLCTAVYGCVQLCTGSTAWLDMAGLSQVVSLVAGRLLGYFGRGDTATAYKVVWLAAGSSVQNSNLGRQMLLPPC